MELCQTIVKRWGLFCFLHAFLFINEVSLQKTVEGFIGDSVVLPCSYKEHQFSIQDITVRWRYNSTSVYNINKGKGSGEEQNSAYKNRTEIFPEEYLKGNFSLKLNNLQNTDTGKYKCYISAETVRITTQSITLLVNERQKRIQNTTNVNEGSNQKPEIIVTIISSLCIGIIFYFG
ncbi:CD276 antigen-like [Pseudorasbora parva]|uniref:CD276 antigen-like n=1 Tax=Pseudorasbora parva TaxID=51549 RepID=UPI00351EB187